MSEGIPAGDFDLLHLQAIHRHLFQDVFDWAGQLRTVEIAKGGHQFQFRRFMAAGLRDVHRRLAARGFLRGLSGSAFAAAAGEIIGDVNYVHPFREGNGRCQLLYLEQLAEQAGIGSICSSLIHRPGSRRPARRTRQIMVQCLIRYASRS